MKRKAIGLLSGGLDSTLAVKVIQEQGIEVIALNFMSPFCTCTAKNAGCKSEAVKVSRAFGVKIKSIFQGEDYLAMVKNPKHGYGRALNPCIDCRIMMFRKAGEYMREVGASFLFTGEVLEPRPMSQRRDAMRTLERESDLEGLILRPLSARLLPETLPEKEGIVDRERLLRIRGRSRKPQMQLAEDFHIVDYPCASGGCLLTEKGFAGKLKDLLDHSEVPRIQDARLLRIGRHFRLSDHCWVIVGRNESENSQLEKIAEPGDLRFTLKDHKGPLALARGRDTRDWVPTISRILVRYGSLGEETSAEVQFESGDKGKRGACRATALEESRLDASRIKGLEK